MGASSVYDNASYYAYMTSNQFGAHGLDPNSPRRFFATLFKALIATAFFRCLHILFFFAAWSTTITVIINHVNSIAIQPTLITVVGTVLGFVISYRTTASFERYNEGRRYWSQIILASRTLARGVWFHIPELPPPTHEDEGRTEDERRARTLIEKKTIINLVEAFAVAVKHYLRGEEGINYVDLYYLVKFLPSYKIDPENATQSSFSLHHSSKSKASVAHSHSETISPEVASVAPPSVPPPTPAEESKDTQTEHPEHPEGPAPSCEPSEKPGTAGLGHERGHGYLAPPPHPDIVRVPSMKHNVSFALNALERDDAHPGELPLPATASRDRLPREKPSFIRQPTARSGLSKWSRRTSFGSRSGESILLLPAAMPPKFTWFDVFPLSLFIMPLSKSGKEIEGKKAARYRARSSIMNHNVPLEVLFYLTSYASALISRKTADTPTANIIINSINQLTDALTGLERILTTPIPFSYSIHIWLVAFIYCMLLPFQIWNTLHWLTIPATTIASFIFFGFIAAGEEIENPFGYDKNDLNMDHFTFNIIRNELLAITSRPPPDISQWAFSPENDHVFSTGTPEDNETVSPDEWLKKGITVMKAALY